jgi:hypothetical protein
METLRSAGDSLAAWFTIAAPMPITSRSQPVRQLYPFAGRLYLVYHLVEVRVGLDVGCRRGLRDGLLDLVI